MSDLFGVIEIKEKDAQSQFLNFIEYQKETAQTLKNSLLGIKDITSQDTLEKINNIKEQLAQISILQEQRKEKVMSTFINFQKMHNKMMESLENLLEKGVHIQIQDIKKIKDLIIKEVN